MANTLSSLLRAAYKANLENRKRQNWLAHHVKIDDIKLDKRQPKGARIVTVWYRIVTDKNRYRPHIGKKQIAKGLQYLKTM